MAIASEANAYGRMRKRIVAVGRANRKGGVLAHGRDSFAKDKSLRVLLQSGAITQQQLKSAISGFTKAPSDFSWLANIDEALLEKADRVFFVSHGRCPDKNADFRLNGDYHRISRSLQYDPHYYDGQLDEISRVGQEDVHAPAREPGEFTSEGLKKTGIWAFSVVLMLGFCSAPLLGMLIVTFFPNRTLTAGLLLGGLWLAILVGALVRTLPRRLN